MNYKEDINKIIEDAIIESNDGTELLNNVLRHFMVEVPIEQIEIQEVSPICGKPYLRGIVYFPFKMQNIRGEIINYDSLKLIDSEIVGYAGNGLFVTSINRDLLKSSYKFYNADIDVINIVLEKLNQYIIMDSDDLEGHIFGAIYCIYERENSPSAIWNEKIKEKHRIEEQKNIEFLQKYEKEKAEKEKAEKEKKEKAEKERQNKINELRKNNSPIFQIWDRNEIIFEIRYNDVIKNNYNIEVPENLIGHIVGKGGDRIKYLSSLYNNKRINIKKIAKIDVSKKISIKVF